MRLLTLALALCLLATQSANAWNETGHRVVAAIAYELLGEEQRRAYVAILRAHPRFQEDFESMMPAGIAESDEETRNRWIWGQASVWPDLTRNLPDDVRPAYERGQWHYINLPVWLREDDEAALSGRLDHNMETRFSPPLRQNLNGVQALRGNLSVWHDDDAAPASKAVALCWILHVAADLHQPLHTVALFSKAWFPEGDRGGNSIAVRREPRDTNLHAAWDRLPSDLVETTPTRRTLSDIETDLVDDAAIDGWVDYHARLAGKYVYTDDIRRQLLHELTAERRPRVELDGAYLDAARSLARRQLNLAGHRASALISAPPHPCGGGLFCCHWTFNRRHGSWPGLGHDARIRDPSAGEEGNPIYRLLDPGDGEEMTKVEINLWVCLVCGFLLPGLASADSVEITSATIEDLNRAMNEGALTAEELTKLYLARINAYDADGPAINAVLTLNPDALETARKLDRERRNSGPRSPLHGIPVVLKDNIDTADLPTTAGSFMLKGSMPPDDAFIVRNLRDAGAIVIAKLNMSEFASGDAMNSLGGATYNPHDTSRSPSGSSGSSCSPSSAPWGSSAWAGSR